jgi:hypothetical protein
VALAQPRLEVFAIGGGEVTDVGHHPPDPFGGVAGETEVLVAGQGVLGAELPGGGDDLWHQRSEVVGVVARLVRVQAGLLQPGLDVVQLAGEPGPRVAGEVDGPGPLGGFVPVEVRVVVGGGERLRRSVKAIEEVGAPEGPVDDDLLRGRFGAAVGLRFEQAELDAGAVLLHRVGRDLEPAPYVDREAREGERDQHRGLLAWSARSGRRRPPTATRRNRWPVPG